MANLEQELYSKWQDDVMAAATESDSEVLSGVESASEERNKLKKQVSRMKRGETSPGGFVELSSVNKPLSAFEGMTENVFTDRLFPNNDMFLIISSLTSLISFFFCQLFVAIIHNSLFF